MFLTREPNGIRPSLQIDSADASGTVVDIEVARKVVVLGGRLHGRRIREVLSEGPDVAWWFYEDMRVSLKRYVAAAGVPGPRWGRQYASRGGQGTRSR